MSVRAQSKPGVEFLEDVEFQVSSERWGMDADEEVGGRQGTIALRRLARKERSVGGQALDHWEEILVTPSASAVR